MMQSGFGKYGIKGFSVADQKEFIEWYEDKETRDKAFEVFRKNRYYKDFKKVEK